VKMAIKFLLDTRIDMFITFQTTLCQLEGYEFDIDKQSDNTIF
jgi:hypothetical protein